jgi:sporulation protein YtfJ
MSIESFTESLLEKLKWIAQAETVVGKPIQSDNATIIPVSRVSLGFGIGGNENEKSDLKASGGGASIDPVAFLVINGDDIRILPITKDTGLLSKISDLIPDLINTLRKDKSSDKSSNSNS